MSGSLGGNEGFRLLKCRNNRLNVGHDDPVRCYTVLTKVRTKEKTADSLCGTFCRMVLFCIPIHIPMEYLGKEILDEKNKCYYLEFYIT